MSARIMKVYREVGTYAVSGIILVCGLNDRDDMLFMISLYFLQIDVIDMLRML